MNKKDLQRALDTEIGGLRYYLHISSKVEMTVDSKLYDEFISIGYTKRPLPLDRRCAPFAITSNEKITIDTNVEDLYIIYELKDGEKNKYTPLEIFWILYPERRREIILNLNCEQSDVKVIEL